MSDSDPKKVQDEFGSQPPQPGTRAALDLAKKRREEESLRPDVKKKRKRK